MKTKGESIGFPLFGRCHGFVFATLCLTLIFPLNNAVFNQESSEDMPHHEVERWAQLIGNHVFHLLNTVAKYSEIEENFASLGATISENDGLALVKQMAEDVTNMMKYKIQAVKRIMNVAEEVSQDPSYLQDEWRGYYNSKVINRNEKFFDKLKFRYGKKIFDYYGSKYKELFGTLELTPNSHFDGTPITLNASTVHVPTNIFEGGEEVKQAIRWSEALEKTFYSNYEHDPTLSWQFFGSSKGFLRQFPGAAWQIDEVDPDLYDTRLRPWYIEAANSPKDMIILLDISGSMTGMRKKIATHVVLNIMETLTNNDFLNIFKFSEETTELVPCFNDTLVQANEENIGVFREHLYNLETQNIANFSLALTKAFKLLQKYHKMGHGAHCNQAIMLITDGAPYTYENIFNEYNWPHLQIRIFSYLIGREVTDMRTLKWMACANKGYFVHVATPSEVREQVLKYIPVMARPMVMYGSKHPITWTGVYADVADPKQTNWLWELRERERQFLRTNNYKKLKKVTESSDNIKYEWALRDKKEVEKFLLFGEFGLSHRDVARINAEKARKIRTQLEVERLNKERWTLIVGRRDRPNNRYGYRLMTTVSVPVYNRTQKQEFVAELLGVAGTDVPIREIEKLVPPYKIGVNGYSFAVNNNGFVLYHPGLRPTHEDVTAEVFRKSKDGSRWFQDILKPNYNSVDLMEAELIDDTDLPRQNHSELATLRRDMIEQRATETGFRVRIHLDRMKRVEIRDQKYFTATITDTPFSLGVALPEYYGKYKVVGQIELSLAMKDNVNFNASDSFNTGKWTVHPEWVYCEYKYDQGVERTAEEQLLHFLVKAQLPGWKWRSTRTRPPPDSSSQARGHQSHYDESDYYCDKTLVQSLLFDAKATDVYNNKTRPKTTIDAFKNHGKHKNFGITTAFVATRSGFTRWLDMEDIDEGDEPHFMDLNNQAIDEVWYKRAVDYYREDPEAYIYSVPFDAAAKDPSQVLVTASRAIFIRQNKFQQAPAAVVGVNIKLDKFIEFFKNETYNCREYSRQSNCKKEMTCKSEFLDCYLLDDSGFIVASEKVDDTGRFFGEIEGTIMESLVQSEVYNRIKIYDYQGVCLESITGGNFASILLNPYHLIKWTIRWLISNIMWVIVRTQLYQMWDPDMIWAYNDYGSGIETPIYPDYDAPPPPPIEPEVFDNTNDEIVTTDENIEVKGKRETDVLKVLMRKLRSSLLVEYKVDQKEREPSATEEGGPSIEVIHNNIDTSKEEKEEEEYDINEEDAVEPPIEETDPFPNLDVQATTQTDKLTPTTFSAYAMEMAYINKTRPRPCDKEVDLYKLNNSKLKEPNSDKYRPVKGKLSNCHSNGCGRPFSVQKVIKTNLVLIVVHNLCPCESRTVGIEPKELDISSEELCEKHRLHHFRKRPGCSNYHPDETSIKECGGVGDLQAPSFIVVLFVVVLFHCVNRT